MHACAESAGSESAERAGPANLSSSSLCLHGFDRARGRAARGRAAPLRCSLAGTASSPFSVGTPSTVGGPG
eukprot:1884054-Prymnesium_polylepis.1